MSNPAVIKYCKKQIGKYHFWIDDNFGESIHIHIDDIRLDLSHAEFNNLCSDLCIAINKLIEVEGFCCEEIDPVYFEFMLANNILDLQRIKIDNVKLSDMIAPSPKSFKPLPISRCVKALNGNSKENDSSIRHSNLMGQTNFERLDIILKSIKENGYPYDNKYIVMYGDDNIIRDGQHRAACLFHLYGDMDVPVLRFYFKNYVPETDIALVRILGVKNYSSCIRIVNAIKKYKIKVFGKCLSKIKTVLKNKRQKKRIESYIKHNKKLLQMREDILIAK